MSLDKWPNSLWTMTLTMLVLKPDAIKQRDRKTYVWAVHPVHATIHNIEVKVFCQVNCIRALYYLWHSLFSAWLSSIFLRLIRTHCKWRWLGRSVFKSNVLFITWVASWNAPSVRECSLTVHSPYSSPPHTHLVLSSEMIIASLRVRLYYLYLTVNTDDQI